MSTKVNLEVVGLCVVIEPDDGGHHTIVAVEPLGDNPAVLPFGVYLTFSKTAFSTFESQVLSHESATANYNRIENDMFKIRIPPETTVVLSDPASPLVTDNAQGDLLPATISELGLGSLKEGVGSGPWQDGELARFLLPSAKARFEWRDDLGKFHFPSAGRTRFVADLFFWEANSDEQWEFTFLDSKNKNIGTLHLDGPAEVRIACYSDAKPRSGQPFDYVQSLSRLCTGNSPQKPERRPLLPLAPSLRKAAFRLWDIITKFHPRSGSCPPVKSP